MNKRALIISNGNLSNIHRLSQIIDKEDFIVCTDGAAKQIIQESLKPHLIIGDLDSISKELITKLKKQNVKFIKYPIRKDKSDFELALDYAIKNKYKEIAVFGLLGNRIDHLLANISLIISIQNKYKNIRLKIIEGEEEIYVADKQITLDGKIGDELSIVPINDNACGITTDGLEYKLINGSLSFGSTRGISNVFIKSQVNITIEKGTIMVIHNRLNK